VRALQEFGLSQVRACAIVGQPRRTLHYRGKPKDDGAIAERTQSLAQERPRWGWRRLLIMIRRDGIEVGEFRFRRIYRSLALQVRPRKKRKVRYVRGNVVPAVTRPNERWSIDFVHDRLTNGRNIRAIGIVDDFTRECLALEVGFSFGSHDVIRCFEDLAFERGFPETIWFDNGSEFTSHAMLRWGAERSVQLHFIDPGKPTQNAQIESLNGKIRDELLNAHSFRTIFEARRKAADWRQDYNEVRPHSALGYQTPREFAAEFQTKQSSQLSAA
jgi:putative transposase